MSSWKKLKCAVAVHCGCGCWFFSFSLMYGSKQYELSYARSKNASFSTPQFLICNCSQSLFYECGIKTFATQSSRLRHIILLPVRCLFGIRLLEAGLSPHEIVTSRWRGTKCLRCSHLYMNLQHFSWFGTKLSWRKFLVAKVTIFFVQHENAQGALSTHKDGRVNDSIYTYT